MKIYYWKKNFQKKAATIKRFEYFSLGKGHFKPQKIYIIDNNSEDGDNKRVDKSGESNITKEFYTIIQISKI